MSEQDAAARAAERIAERLLQVAHRPRGASELAAIIREEVFDGAERAAERIESLVRIAATDSTVLDGVCDGSQSERDAMRDAFANIIREEIG